MVPPSILRGMQTEAAIDAHPPVVSGVRGEPEEKFTLLVAPLDSLSPDVIERFRIEAPLQKRVTYAYTSEVIRAGMYLRISGRQYPISGVERYPEGDYTFYEIVVDDIQVV